MSIAQWNNFTDYVVGNQVQNGSSLIYGCILANKNEPPPNATYWNPLTPSGGGNIVSIQALTNADITFSSPDIDYKPDPLTGNIIMGLFNPAPTTYVEAVNSISGIVSLTSPTNSITITPNGLDIELEVNTASLPPQIATQSGTYTETTGGSTGTTITAALCLTTSIIQLTYIHVGIGGAAQFIKDIVPNNGSFTVVTNTAVDIGDRINWLICV